MLVSARHRSGLGSRVEPGNGESPLHESGIRYHFIKFI